MADRIFRIQAPTTRERLREALQYRDELWDAVIEDLAERDPRAARTVQEILAQWPELLFSGRSTSYAAWAWSALDTQARSDWIWACETIQEVWIRGSGGDGMEFG